MSAAVTYKAKLCGREYLGHLTPNRVSGGYWIQILKLQGNVVKYPIYEGFAKTFDQAQRVLFSHWKGVEWVLANGD